jgi:signal transduction histidine kinase
VNTQIQGVDPLIRANKLDLLERVADDLAHEIKNPLHSMVINLEVLKRRISRAGAPEATDMLRYADVLGSELERVSQRVDLLLRMVRPGRGDVIPLQEALDEVRELVEVEGSRRSLRVGFGTNHLGSRASAPRDAARQVILNMVLAVMDSLGAGDGLEIETARDEQAVHIRVSGVPAERGADAPADPTPEDDAADRGALSVVELLGEFLGGRVAAHRASGALALTFSYPAYPA